MLGATHVRRTTESCAAFLEAHLDTDWTVRIGDLDMSVAEVAAHVSECCLWYAIDLAAGGRELDLVEHRVVSDSTPAELVDTLRAYSSILAAVVETSSPTARGFHPMGSADPSGFAAMACDEMLIHTDDVARGFGLTFTPLTELAEPVLRRLFPWIAEVTEAWQQLRWANGRTTLGDRERLNDWAWHCAPISEWDGTVATRP